MAMIHVINGQLKVVDRFNEKQPVTKNFYLDGKPCNIEVDKSTTKLVIKAADDDKVILKLDIDD